MHDFNHLMGFVFHSRSQIAFRSIKDKLVQIATEFESDDVGVVMGTHCYGSGEILGNISNVKRLLNENEFINIIKSTFRLIGQVDADCPKFVFIISDAFSPAIIHTLNKLCKINKIYDYEVKLCSVSINANDKYPEYIAVNNIESLPGYINNIIQDVN